MGRNDNLIILTPHTLCSFDTDPMRFFRCDLTGAKALIAVIRNIAAELAVSSFGGHHCLIRSFLRTVYTADVHCLICLVAVLNVIEGSS